MPGMFPSQIFRFKIAMATYSNMAAIWLKNFFLNINIKQFLVINWSKIVNEFKMAAIIDPKTMLQNVLKW